MTVEEIIIYEDDNIIALGKPSGVLAIPDRFNKELINLYDLLNTKYGRIFIVHRLDRDTSGVILFAKNAEAHRDLSMKWEKGQVSKTYDALCYGHIEKKQGTINLPIAPLKKKKGVMVIDRKNGKPSVTNYRVIKECSGYTLLDAMPKTGRTHQIRVHLAAIGHPVAGDKLYNRNEAINIGHKDKNIKFGVRDGKFGIIRLMLHAQKLKFVNYMHQEVMEIVAQVPEDFKRVIDVLSSEKQEN